MLHMFELPIAEDGLEYRRNAMHVYTQNHACQIWDEKMLDTLDVQELSLLSWDSRKYFQANFVSDDKS